jgi:hypothetical protein
MRMDGGGKEGVSVGRGGGARRSRVERGARFARAPHTRDRTCTRGRTTLCKTLRPKRARPDGRTKGARGDPTRGAGFARRSARGRGEEGWGAHLRRAWRRESRRRSRASSARRWKSRFFFATSVRERGGRCEERAGDGEIVSVEPGETR